MNILNKLSFITLFVCQIIQTTPAGQTNEWMPVKDSYPHAQQWYEKITHKYPDLSLKNIEFVYDPADKFTNHEWGWKAYLATIQCPLAIIAKINTIYHPENYLQLKDKPEVLTFLRIQEAILIHEAAHVQHFDVLKRGILSLILFLGLIKLSYQEAIKSQTEEPSLMHTAVLGKLLLFVTTGYIINHFITRAYSRRTEAQADDMVCKLADRAILESFADACDIRAKEDNAKIQALLTAHAPVGSFFYKLKQKIYDFDITHPHTKDRAAKFRKAAQEKEQQEQAHLKS